MEISALSDDALTRHLRDSVARENKSLAAVLHAMAEFDRRRLHETLSFPSLFEYCTKELGYSEEAAFKRITVCRAIRKYGSLLERIRSGGLSLAAASLLTPHLTAENHRSIIDQACGRSKRDVEKIVAALNPAPVLLDVIRRMPSPPAAPPPAPGGGASGALTVMSAGDSSKGLSAPRQKIEPIAPSMIRFAFTADERFEAALERCRQLLRHKYPRARLEEIFTEALEALLDAKDPDRRKARPRIRCSNPEARRVPRWVRDAVWKRDKGCCAMQGPDGRRCGAREFVEFDHIRPWALGGKSNDPANIRLLCRAHNQMAARRFFGARAAGGADGGNGRKTAEA